MTETGSGSGKFLVSDFLWDNSLNTFLSSFHIFAWEKKTVVQILAEQPKWSSGDYFQFKFWMILFLWMFTYSPVPVQPVERRWLTEMKHWI